MFSITEPDRDMREMADGLYSRAFPLNERIPIDMIHRSCSCEGFRYRCFTDDGKFVGLSYTIETSSLLYVVYLAIDESCRSGGYGGRALRALMDEAGKRTFLNIEPVVEGCDNYDQRVSRRRFYERNGFREHGLLGAPDGNTFMVMVANGDVSDEEIQQIYSGDTVLTMLRNAGTE